MKQYLLFTYYVGRPLGGAKDFLDSFDTVEEALDNILEEWTRYYQVVDRDTMETVKEGLARFKHFTSEGFAKENDNAKIENDERVNRLWNPSWKRSTPPTE